MLQLCGFAVSNYYNKVKLGLLEKGVAFAEEKIYPAQSDSVRSRSPMGKVPFLRTPQGVLTESQVLVEYIEDTCRDTPLYPADPYERAKCRELIEHIELYLELPARRLYPQAFFGGTVSDEVKAEVEKQLALGLRSLAQLARFAPFIAGETLTHADCAAWAHLPLVSQATRAVYGRDMLDELVPAAKPYLKQISARPHAQKVAADRKTATEEFLSFKAKANS